MFSIGTALRETGQVLDRIGCSMQGSNAFREAISKHRTIMGIYEKVPALPRAGFIAPSASVIGDVTIGEKSSVWYGAVLRGDVNSIRIGAQTNIQDNTVIHVAKTNVGGVAAPTIIGDDFEEFKQFYTDWYLKVEKACVGRTIVQWTTEGYLTQVRSVLEIMNLL